MSQFWSPWLALGDFVWGAARSVLMSADHTERPMPTLRPGHGGQSTAVSACPYSDIWWQWLTKDNQESYSPYFIVEPNLFWVQIFLRNIHGVVNGSLVCTPKDTPYTSCLDFLSLSIQVILLPGPWPASTAIHIAHMPLYFLRLGYFSQTKYW